MYVGLFPGGRDTVGNKREERLLLWGTCMEKMNLCNI